MDDSLADNEDEYLEHDSLSDESFSKDSLLNGHHIEDQRAQPSANKRRGSYTLETSPEMSTSIRNRHLTQPIYVQTENNLQSSEEHKSSNKSRKHNMSQSLYERPTIMSGPNNSLSSANSKLREEKLRLAKEEQDKKQKQKIAVLTESEKIAQSVRRRKETEALKKIEENKKKSAERQRIVDERRERLNKAEEARRKAILRKLVNYNGKKPSPQSSSNMMTMSCYGGFGSARTRPGNKEVVHNRFLNTRPVSSTGKIIGFGSSTPRPICENNPRLNSDNKKIPEAILIKCELLSRPVSTRISDKMQISVISPQISTTVAKKTQRQSSVKEKDSSKRIPTQSTMTTSMIDFSPKYKGKPHSINKSDTPIKEEINVDQKRNITPENRPSSSLSNTSKRSEEASLNKKGVTSKSGTFPRRVRKTKVDTHLDSDSIEEEVSLVTKPNKLPSSVMPDHSSDSHGADVQPKVRIMERNLTSTNQDSNSQNEGVKAVTTKDLSETEYKARLMENRRLAREKREKEREQLMKSERDRRHAEEIAARELMEIEREKKDYLDETHFTTSNDDTLDGVIEQNKDRPDEIEFQLSEIPEMPSITGNEISEQSNQHDAEKNERKKQLDSIMSRIRKTNDESSSEGGISPRRAMSPEPAELEPDITSSTSTPAFRSSLLQSMMNNKGRLSKVPSPNKDTKEEVIVEDIAINIPPVLTGANLSSVRETNEDSESQLTNVNPPSSVIIHSSANDGNSLSDTNSEFLPELILEPLETKREESDERDFTTISGAPSIPREDCDGKEDSLSINENRINRECPKINDVNLLNNIANSSSVSSAETEEEEIIKAPFEIDSVYKPIKINSIIQEGCVFQN